MGDYSHGGELNQALHWNGSKWSSVTTPNPGGTTSGAFNALAGVRCLTSTHCWAVGYYVRGGAELNEALRWNGARWSLVRTPDLAGRSMGDFNNLFDVKCTSTRSCWAVGQFGVLSGSTETILNQALHWNGKKWSHVSTPNPEGTGANDANALETIQCPSRRDCWAVGTYGFVGIPTALLNEALHWNGQAWSEVTTPNPGGTGANADNTLSGLFCVSSTNCWAAVACVGLYTGESPVSVRVLDCLGGDVRPDR